MAPASRFALLAAAVAALASIACTGADPAANQSAITDASAGGSPPTGMPDAGDGVPDAGDGGIAPSLDADAVLLVCPPDGLPCVRAEPGADFMSMDLTGQDLSSQDLTGATFFGATLVGANFSGATLSNASLSTADLTNADLQGAVLTGADLTRADLTGANLSGVDLSEAILEGVIAARLPVCPAALPQGWQCVRGGGGTHSLVGPSARVYYADLSGVDFGDFDLTGASLYGSDVSGANLSRATLADFEAAQLEGSCPSAVPTGWGCVRGSGGTLSLVGPGARLDDADLAGADLSGLDLTGADLSGLDLTGVDFTGTDLTGADLRGSIGVRLAGGCPSAVSAPVVCVTAGSGSWLLGPFSHLQDADLRGADLGGLDLSFSFLTGADLRDANLNGAQLGGALLEGARVQGADMGGVMAVSNLLSDPTGMRATRLDACPAVLPPAFACLTGGGGTRSLVGPGADLTNADLTGLDLGSFDLRLVNVAGADLRGARLGPDLAGVDFSGVSLDGVDLAGADLAGARTTGLAACPVQVPGPTWRCIGAGTAYVPTGPYALLGPGVEVHFGWCVPGLEGLDLTGANISTMCALQGCDFAGVHFEGTTCPDGTLSDDRGGTCAAPIACPATGF